MTYDIEADVEVVARNLCKSHHQEISNAPNHRDGYIEDHWEEFTYEARSALQASNAVKELTAAQERIKTLEFFLEFMLDTYEGGINRDIRPELHAAWDLLNIQISGKEKTDE